MALSRDTGEYITSVQAAKYIGDYCNLMPKGALKSCFYGRNKIENILKPEEIIGIRIYQAINSKNEQSFVLKVVNDKGEELEGVNCIVEYGIRETIS